MKYVWWLWQQSRGIRWNSVIRIVTGVAQVSLGLTMVWLSRHFIDKTIRTGSTDDIIRMITLHTITFCGHRMDAWWSEVMAWSFFFMCFFFFKAGYFNKTVSGDTKAYLKDKFKRLMIP